MNGFERNKTQKQIKAQGLLLIGARWLFEYWSSSIVVLELHLKCVRSLHLNAISLIRSCILLHSNVNGIGSAKI